MESLDIHGPPRARYEYDDCLDDVSRALGNLDRHGDCFVCGSLPNYPPPGVEIRGADNADNAEQVPLPLTDDMAKRVIAKCRLAPYGHGEKTLVNTDVRNTWELNVNEIAITNPQWTPFVQSILRAIRKPLGIAEAAQVDAKLYKLLLYEEGGKFERHQDEGARHIWYPCATEGEPHVWSPSTASAFDVKCAAFYGDCAHEVKPVTSGYRLCLTYNLVTTMLKEIPRFVSTTSAQPVINQTLTNFFAVDDRRKRVKRDDGLLTAAYPTNRQFVYVLEHDHSDQGLRFEYLKNKDHVVAHALATLCETTLGKLMVSLARFCYWHVSDTESDYLIDAEISVTLKNPWVKYGSTEPRSCSDVQADHTDEIAPAGFLETIVDFDYYELEFTGNEGTTKAQWYDTAVIQSTEVEFEQLVLAPTNKVVATLARFVETKAPRTLEFANRILTRGQGWTSTSPDFLACLTIVMEFHDRDLFLKLLRTVWQFQFEPRVRDAVIHFGWDTCLPTFLGIARATQFRSRVSLVCSLLTDETDTTRIAQVLDAVGVHAAQINWPQERFGMTGQLTRYAGSSHVGDSSCPTAPELCRVLELISRLSHASVVEHLTTTNDATVAYLIVPALELFTASRPIDESLSQHTAVLLQDFQCRVPMLRNADYRDIVMGHGCDACTQVQAFLSSNETAHERLIIKNETQLKHVERRISDVVRWRARVRATVVSPLTLEVTKEFTPNKLIEQMQRAIETLEKITTRSPTSSPNAS